LGTPHVLFQTATLHNGPYVVTADGKRFLVNSEDVNEAPQPLTLVENWTAELKK